MSVACYPQTNTPPTITATGNQNYCPLSDINIVTNFDIIPGNEQIDAVFIQISENYSNGEDTLFLTNVATHTNISTTWISEGGKLKLEVITPSATSYTDLIAAVKDVFFNSTSTNFYSEKYFSFTIDEANYLPSTGHYYEYVSDVGISWTDAKVTAETKTHYGLQGYLATLTSTEEAQLAGKQAEGTGWIGASDEETEGTWKWMTGPEAGKTFWFGNYSGSSAGADIPFSFWNTGEPNNLGDEDYAHITAPTIGITGSWNDLKNIGEASGDYQPKGYIVEYGGMPGDPTLNLSASTKITVPSILSVTSSKNCGSGTTVTLNATASAGDVVWFDSLTSSTPIFTGTSFSTPILASTKTYYVLASVGGCLQGERKTVIATINTIPTITSTTDDIICDAGVTTLKATASEGIIAWYKTLTNGTSIFIGESFETPFIYENKTYYVEAVSNGCTSLSRVPVQAIVQYTKTPINLNLSLNNFDIINNSITIKNKANFGNGAYTFSIDNIDGPYQEATTFENLTSGFHTIFILDNTICGFDKIEIPILGFPKYFTPNNDGVNDTWHLKGFSSDIYPTSKIFIFDRFGKLMGKINPINNEWNGAFNGKMLPSSDYWFTVQLTNSKGIVTNYKGHFSLLRQ